MDSKKNNRVLGMLIRSERINKGYSLRELGQKTNISHTLISNIEHGKQVPSNHTLQDLFRELDIVFHVNPELHKEFTEKSAKIYNYIFNHYYEEAGILINQLTEHDNELMYSIDGVDYIVIKGLYYASVNKKLDGIRRFFDLYSSLFDFFTDDQKQIVYFIQGMVLLLEQQYNKATDCFKEALRHGNKELDVLIQQYLAESLVKQYKFIDAYRICTEIIKEFEERSIYIRAMKTKILVANIFYHIAKNNEVYEITSNVLRFARKYNVPELLEECIRFHVEIDIRNREFEKAEEQLLNMPDQHSDMTVLLRFKFAYIKDDFENMKKYYDILSEQSTIQNNQKVWKYLQVQVMSKVPGVFDKEKYLELIKWLIEFSTKNNDQEMITLSYNYLIMFYHQERSYKKALEVADKLLHFKKIRIDNQF